MTALAAIHVAKKQLGLDDDTYRAMLVQVTGKDSTRDMTEAERGRVIEHLRKRGFQPALMGGRKALGGPFAKKLQALWIAAWNLGIVSNRDDAALVAFVKRQTGIDHVRFLQNPGDAAKAIEALKSWMAREAGVEWGKISAVMSSDPARIAWAQWRILVPGATVMDNAGAWRTEIGRILGRRITAAGQLTATEWRDVMNAFGRRVREARTR